MRRNFFFQNHMVKKKIRTTFRKSGGFRTLKFLDFHFSFSEFQSFLREYEKEIFLKIKSLKTKNFPSFFLNKFFRDLIKNNSVGAI